MGHNTALLPHCPLLCSFLPQNHHCLQKPGASKWSTHRMEGYRRLELEVNQTDQRLAGQIEVGHRVCTLLVLMVQARASTTYTHLCPPPSTVRQKPARAPHPPSSGPPKWKRRCDLRAHSQIKICGQRQSQARTLPHSLPTPTPTSQGSALQEYKSIGSAGGHAVKTGNFH